MHQWICLATANQLRCRRENRTVRSDIRVACFSSLTTQKVNQSKTKAFSRRDLHWQFEATSTSMFTSAWETNEWTTRNSIGDQHPENCSQKIVQEVPWRSRFVKSSISRFHRKQNANKDVERKPVTMITSRWALVKEYVNESYEKKLCLTLDEKLLIH